MRLDTKKAAERIVCQFSCGAASAVATKLMLAEFPKDRVLIVNAFIQEEHPDNRRFLADCEKWFDHPVTVLRNEKFSSSTDEVWRRRRYIKGPNGAPCSLELKRKLLATISEPGDVDVLGLTVEEVGRFEDFCDNNPGRTLRAPLIEKNLSKDDCFAIVDRAGIELPEMYRMGYSNANCIGCPKGGQAYWQNIREDFPERFAAVMEIQENIGPNANFLRFRSGPRKGERMALRDLPAGRGDMREGLNFSCSFFCDMTITDLAALHENEGPTEGDE